MKKASRRQFKQCVLEPVDRKASCPLPGVPEHFNYGVFFDDDCDYLRHLKSASEFHEKAAY
ncbi:protein LTV1, partial [Clonorchis sinensis]